MRFRKKPVVIEAWLWDTTTATRLKLEAEGMISTRYEGYIGRPDDCHNLGIRTLEGSMRVNPGDYIIKGIKGEFYPCKPDIFEATYDAVEE
jgi:hypothetical protein